MIIDTSISQEQNLFKLLIAILSEQARINDRSLANDYTVSLDTTKIKYSNPLVSDKNSYKYIKTSRAFNTRILFTNKDNETVLNRPVLMFYQRKDIDSLITASIENKTMDLRADERVQPDEVIELIKTMLPVLSDDIEISVGPMAESQVVSIRAKSESLLYVGQTEIQIIRSSR